MQTFCVNPEHCSVVLDRNTLCQREGIVFNTIVHRILILRLSRQTKFLHAVHAVQNVRRTSRSKPSHRSKLSVKDELLTESLLSICSNSVLLRHRAVVVLSTQQCIPGRAAAYCEHLCVLLVKQGPLEPASQ